MIVMMAWILAAVVVILGLVNLASAWYFARGPMGQHRDAPKEWQPRAAVVLCVRGRDPTLERALRSLLAQAYADYRVEVILDHPHDAARQVLDRAAAEFDPERRLRISILGQAHTTCGLKCSALAQAIESLGNDVEVVVLVDADVNPNEHWLSRAVAPLADPTVGVVSGYQWFEPARHSWAAMVRSIWNAGALVPTAILANPWGGTAALRLADIRRSQLVRIWRQAIIEDGPLREALAAIQLRPLFHPDLININREPCDWSYVNSYITRMMTWARMYEPRFALTITHMITSAGGFLACCVGFVAALLSGSVVAGLLGVALVVRWLVTVVAFGVIRRAVAVRAQRRGERLGSLGLAGWFQVLLLVPLCDIGHGWWMLRAMFARRVAWRQIHYELRGRGRVKMLGYAPLAPQSDSAVSVK
jgi:glycosyltransferase involved in cell wall biosynthesis